MHHEASNDTQSFDPASKLQVAKQCLLTLIGQLKETDYFGLILFDDRATTLQPLESVQKINMPDLKEKIQKIATRGGTNMVTGKYP